MHLKSFAKAIITLSILLSTIISLAQKNPKAIEADLKKQFQKIWYWDEHHEMNDTIDTYDSIQRANDCILNQIVKQGNKNTASLAYSFTSLEKYLDVLTSGDKTFRIYSWDTYTGGTMHIFYAVAQFIGNDQKVYTQSLVDTSEGDPGLWYSKIYTFNNKAQKFYFCIGHGIYSSRDIGQQLIVYAVKGNRLVQAPIIKTQKGLTNIIYVNYNLPAMDNKTDNSIAFDEKTNELKIPLVDAKGNMTTKYIIYRFNGNHFERNGIR